MTQKEVDVIFSMINVTHTHKWFGSIESRVGVEILNEWVSKQLAGSLGIYTTPCGASWGTLSTKQEFDDYWTKNSKLNY